jgi:hypothetical protein
MVSDADFEQQPCQSSLSSGWRKNKKQNGRISHEEALGNTGLSSQGLDLKWIRGEK